MHLLMVGTHLRQESVRVYVTVNAHEYLAEVTGELPK